MTIRRVRLKHRRARKLILTVVDQNVEPFSRVREQNSNVGILIAVEVMDLCPYGAGTTDKHLLAVATVAL